MIFLQTINKIYLITAAVIIATVIISSVLVYDELINSLAKQKLVDHTYLVISKFQNMIYLLTDAQSGARAYLLTGNYAYLTSFDSDQTQINNIYDELVKLTSDNSHQQMRLVSLQPLIAKRLSLLSDYVTQRTDVISDPVKTNVLVGNGKSVMNSITQIVTDATTEEQNLLVERNNESIQSSDFTILLIVTTTVTIVILAILMIYLINRVAKRGLEETTKAILETEKLRTQAVILEETVKAKDQFAAMMSHEIKTPIVPISGYSELLLDGTLGTLSDIQKEKIQIISENSFRLSRLVQDMIDSYRMGLDKLKLDVKEISCNELINQCMDSFRPLAEKMKIRLDSKSEDIAITCDPNRLQQVLTNLVSNSLKYVQPSHGIITISTKLDGEHVVFTVEDNGVGIPKDKQSELFHPFYQADTSLTRKPGGTGLGLSISKGLVELHGGKIWIESETGKGTAVHFTIPYRIPN